MFQSNEIFNGSIPPVCMMQILRAVDFSSWKECYVGCSGTFTFERAISSRWPKLPMHGNDVSLMSAVIAGVAMNKPQAFQFKGRIAHWEELLQGSTETQRAGALILALFLGRVYGGPSEHAKRHWMYYENRFSEMVDKSAAQVVQLASGLRLQTYYGGDFRDHLRRGIENGAGVIVSAPFIAGWYEKWFRFINENLEWSPPSYEIWNPDQFPALMDEIDASGAPYVMVYKDSINDKRLVCYHRIGMKPKFFVYSNTKALSSVVDRDGKFYNEPFAYKPIDIDRVTKTSKVEIFKCKAGAADYVRRKYLQENIPMAPAAVNLIVYVDDMVAGVICYREQKFVNRKLGKVNDQLYLLSDTATTRFGRISKLIAMLATSRVCVDEASKTLAKREKLTKIVTSVRSNNPISMKYRGIYDLVTRKDAPEGERSGAKYVIQYQSGVREQPLSEIYGEWFAKHFKDDRQRKVTTSYAK